MKLSIVALAVIFASAVAQPRHHQRHHGKRDTIWVTETKLVTATAWVDGDAAVGPQICTVTTSVPCKYQAEFH